MRGVLVAGVVSVLAGCSGGASPALDTGGLVDGARLRAPLVISKGETITIPRGARILASPAAVITVRGVLIVSSAGAPARIAGADAADAWGGIVVESGGRLDAEGLDLSFATTALAVKAGSLGARYDAGTITGGGIPFQIDAGARLDTAHANVVRPGASSGVDGELHASYLDYEASVLGGGIIMGDPSAVFDASDSTFHSTPTTGGDFIVSYAASLVRVSYSTVNDAHCAFHFDDVTRFEIDHVTAGATTPGGPGGLVAWGAMLYGSGAGPHAISNSNFMGTTNDLDEMPPNGPITITNTYTTGKNPEPASWTWPPADVAQAPVLDAKPR